jgi:hypothetical protein
VHQKRSSSNEQPLPLALALALLARARARAPFAIPIHTRAVKMKARVKDAMNAEKMKDTILPTTPSIAVRRDEA